MRFLPPDFEGSICRFPVLRFIVLGDTGSPVLVLLVFGRLPQKR